MNQNSYLNQNGDAPFLAIGWSAYAACEEQQQQHSEKNKGGCFCSPSFLLHSRIISRQRESNLVHYGPGLHTKLEAYAACEVRSRYCAYRICYRHTDEAYQTFRGYPRLQWDATPAAKTNYATHALEWIFSMHDEAHHVLLLSI